MDGGDDPRDADYLPPHHAAIEVSLRSSLSTLRALADAASPPAGDDAQLLAAQRRLLRVATARLARKGLSTDTETYRRLGVLVPRWKHPQAFEDVLVALRDYWRRHRNARSLGHAAPYCAARRQAATYLRGLAEGRHGRDGDDGGEADADNADAADARLPSCTMVRVFRLVNGNLEVPPTLFKALASAGRIQDVFFPDEPDTWQRIPLPSLSPSPASSRYAGSDYGSAYGSQSDPGGSRGSSNGGGNNNEDDDDVIVIERDDVGGSGLSSAGGAHVGEAMVQFMQQLSGWQSGGGGGNSSNVPWPFPVVMMPVLVPPTADSGSLAGMAMSAAAAAAAAAAAFGTAHGHGSSTGTRARTHPALPPPSSSASTSGASTGSGRTIKRSSSVASSSTVASSSSARRRRPKHRMSAVSSASSTVSSSSSASSSTVSSYGSSSSSSSPARRHRDSLHEQRLRRLLGTVGKGNARG